MSFLKKYFPYLTILLVVILIFVTNYKAGTYLIGWDNFNSELNPWLAVTQAFNASWSNFRSFGLPAGMAYATDLWHALTIWILSLFLPHSPLRYIYQSLLFLTGSLGIFSLFKFFKLSSFFSLIASLFYLLNFGTVQIFSLPYEPFSAFFAFLPWALLAFFNLLHGSYNRKNLFFFSISNLLLSSAFYVQTIFIVYALILSLISFVYIAENRKALSPALKKLSTLALIIFALNSYWLLNQIYFITSSSVDVVRTAKQTLLGWDIPYFQNYQHSNLFDFFTQIGYYTDFTNSSGLSIFQPWLLHFQNPLIRLLQFITIAIILIGVLDGKNKYKKYFLPLLFLHATTLLMSLPLFSQLNSLLRQVSIIDQILRSPFSKFTMSLSLVLAFFFTLGLQNLFSKLSRQRLLLTLKTAAIIFLLTLSFPSFQGHYFANEMKVTIPQEYFDLSKYLNSQPSNQRLAILPETNTYGWYDYDWNYTGSGFLWHLISQPIVSRSYDVWSQNSENYYWELTRSLLTRDQENVKNTLEKYQISYVLVDKSLNNGPAKSRSKQLDIAHNYLSQFTPVFTSDNLTLYHINTFTDFSTSDSLPNILPLSESDTQDYAYKNHSDYQSNPNIPVNYYYPFKDLQTQTYLSNQTWTLSEEKDSFTITTTLPPKLPDTPIFSNNPTLNISRVNNSLSVSFPKIKVPYQNYTSPYDCSSKDKLSNLRLSNDNPNLINIAVIDQSKACWSYHFDALTGALSYLLSFSPSTITGTPPSFYVNSHTTQLTLTEQQVNKVGHNLYILPSTSPQDLGISLQFQYQSYKNQPNHFISTIPALYIFPESSLKELHFTLTDILSAKPQSIPSSQISPWLYKVNLDLQTQHLIFNQSYSPAWIAFSLNNNRINTIKDHYPVNTWQNSWNISGIQNQAIYILFWPQLLEFLGFILVPTTLLLALKRQK